MLTSILDKKTNSRLVIMYVSQTIKTHFQNDINQTDQ